jgi:SOS-response transcriptional repressor LexA
METTIIGVEPIIKYIKVPSLIHVFSCGPSERIEDDMEYYLVPENTANSVKSPYVIEAGGNSMLPKIKPGDKLLVDHDAQPTNGDIVVAYINGEFTIKHYYPVNGKIILSPSNSEYKPIIIEQHDDFRILGVVSKIIIDAEKVNTNRSEF